MSDKQANIKKMLEMQQMFMKLEHESGVSSETYYTAPTGHALHNYREEYARLAMEVCDMAHAEKKSHRD
jgi:hypothetical protein